jgi:spermidine synthase
MRLDPASAWLRPLLYGLIVAVGTLVGVELPLLLRLQKAETTSVEAVSSSLASDYAGSLVASLLFPLLAVPVLGLVRTSLLTGAVNAALAASVGFVMPSERGRARLTLPCCLVSGALIVLALSSDALHLVPRE